MTPLCHGCWPLVRVHAAPASADDERRFAVPGRAGRVTFSLPAGTGRNGTKVTNPEGDSRAVESELCLTSTPGGAVTDPRNWICGREADRVE